MRNDNFAMPIISSNPTSLCHEVSGKGGIDKLEIVLPKESLSTETLLSNALSMSFQITREYFRNYKANIRLRSGLSEVFCCLKGDEQNECYKLVCNPSKFENFQHFLGVISGLTGELPFKELKIRRVDFSIDFPVKPIQILQGLDVKFKRSRKQFFEIDKSSSGVSVGRRPEVINVYDKAKVQRTKRPLTRLEIQLTASKVPFKNLYELGQALKDQTIGNSFKPFKNLSISKVIPSPSLLLQNSSKERSQLEMSVLINKLGFLMAKNLLNSSNNFGRNFKKNYESIPWATQPDEILRRSLKMFAEEV